MLKGLENVMSLYEQVSNFCQSKLNLLALDGLSTLDGFRLVELFVDLPEALALSEGTWVSFILTRLGHQMVGMSLIVSKKDRYKFSNDVWRALCCILVDSPCFLQNLCRSVFNNLLENHFVTSVQASMLVAAITKVPRSCTTH